MGEIQKQTQAAVNRDDIMNVLHQICPSISAFVDSQKCESFIHVFGDKAVDMLLTKATPEAICIDGLQICSKPDDPVVYKVLFPMVAGEDLTYTAIEENFGLDARFHYKIYLGDGFPDNDLLVINVHPSKCQVDLTINNNLPAKECQEPFNCSQTFDAPDTTIWYKLDITPTQVYGSSRFELTALYTKKVTPMGTDDVEVHNHSVPWMILFMTVAPLFIACCCMCCIKKCRQRTCRGRKCPVQNKPAQQMAQNTAVQQKQKDSVEIPMEPVNNGTTYFIPAQQNNNGQVAPPAYPYPYFFTPSVPQYTPFQVQQPQQRQ
jgi:hypothetical protein